MRLPGFSGEYEKDAGFVIIEAFKDKELAMIPAVLVDSHGPFTGEKTRWMRL